MEFEEEEPIEILETGSMIIIKKKYVEIMTYLDKKLDFDQWIDIVDESTSNKRKNVKKTDNTINKNTKNKEQLNMEIEKD